MTDAITVFAIVDTAQQDLEAVRTAVSRLAQQSLIEPGCQGYDVYRSQKDPLRLIIHEIWADETALEQHRRTAHVAAFKAALACTGASLWASMVFLETGGTP